MPPPAPPNHDRAHFVVTQDQTDKRFYLALHVRRMIIPIGHGFQLRADCNAALDAVIKTSETTPVMSLEDE